MHRSPLALVHFSRPTRPETPSRLSASHPSSSRLSDHSLPARLYTVFPDPYRLSLIATSSATAGRLVEATEHDCPLTSTPLVHADTHWNPAIATDALAGLFRTTRFRSSRALSVRWGPTHDHLFQPLLRPLTLVRTKPISRFPTGTHDPLQLGVDLRYFCDQ